MKMCETGDYYDSNIWLNSTAVLTKNDDREIVLHSFLYKRHLSDIANWINITRGFPGRGVVFYIDRIFWRLP